jgi:UDP-glucose 4-epimerase
MKVMVIGGSGFLGSHIADALSENGHTVRIFDCKSSPWLQESQEMIVGDIQDVDAVRSAITDCEIVFHYAGVSDLNFALAHPVETANINVLGTLNVLEACRSENVKRIVFASSLYALSDAGGFYRWSKASCEDLIEEYQRRFGVNYTILRYGSLYGPRSDSTNGLHRIVSEALSTGNIRYSGSSDTLREYIYVSDAAQFSVDALGEKFENQAVIISGHQSMKVTDVLHLVSEILGNAVTVEFLDERYEAHYVRTPYSYRDRTALKYTPTLHTDIGQGILRLIEDVERSKQ